MVDPPTPDAEKLAALRGLLPATGAGIFLDTAARGPLPAETASAMREADEWELRVGRATAGREEDLAQRRAEARAVLAALVVGDPTQVALTSGVEHALAVAAAMPDWRQGDTALTVASAGDAVFAALHGLAARHGLELEAVDLAEARTDEDVTLAVTRRVTPRTRLVMLPHVEPLAGRRLPIAQVAGALGPRGPWLAVDASQSAGAIAIDSDTLGADMLAIAGDAWLLGPEGTGGLWVGRRGMAEGRASLPGIAAFETIGAGVARPWPDARRFELDGLPRTAALGLARSVGWLEMYVGLEWAFERASSLAGWTLEALAALDGVEVLTPADQMAGIVSFRLSAWRAAEAADELGRRVFAIVRPLPELDALRASVAWFNTREELSRFVDAVAELARHTPSTLPRRPGLVVLPAEP